jgi:hypothetical protein
MAGKGKVRKHLTVTEISIALRLFNVDVLTAEVHSVYGNESLS